MKNELDGRKVTYISWNYKSDRDGNLHLIRMDDGRGLLISTEKALKLFPRATRRRFRFIKNKGFRTT